MVLYDGSPDYPKPDRMWEFCAKHRVEILGISPTLVRTLATKGDDLPKKHDLSSLRAFASTGEPWNLTPWEWLFEVVGNKQLPIIKGDQHMRCISAASIVAKVARDQLMAELAKDFPVYGFEKHKGYATETHRRAIESAKPCVHHRKTFGGVKEHL